VTDFRRLVEVLRGGDVEFVLIGGLALVLHGSTRVTEDFDLCYARDGVNLQRLADALAPFRPRLRGVPEDLGDVDLLGEVPGVGGFDEVARDATTVSVYGHALRLMSLNALERAKRCAGRAKDLIDLGEIAAIRARTRQ
jgi:hypothetical protein